MVGIILARDRTGVMVEVEWDGLGRMGGSGRE